MPNLCSIITHPPIKEKGKGGKRAIKNCVQKEDNNFGELKALSHQGEGSNPLEGGKM